MTDDSSAYLTDSGNQPLDGFEQTQVGRAVPVGAGRSLRYVRTTEAIVDADGNIHTIERLVTIDEGGAAPDNVL